MKPARYMLIHEDGPVELRDIGTLDEMQEAVGGLITSVPVLDAESPLPIGSTVLANDEGLLIGMRRNQLAEFLTGYPHLAGPVLIGGELDEEGETQSIATDTIIDTLSSIHLLFEQAGEA